MELTVSPPKQELNELVGLLESAVSLARQSYRPDIDSTEDGFIAWVILQELRRSKYRIVSATGFAYPDQPAETPTP
jgi:hypothetical protein